MSLSLTVLLQQTMTPEQAEKFRYNILDITKVWPHSEFPLREVGKLTLNKNPENYFSGQYRSSDSRVQD